jgi:hypothetical protein
VRMGRFTCIPIAEAQPAAAQALEAVSEESGVEVVTLKSLSPRELALNLGLPAREAEAARQRDFDEPFFLAGASENDVERFREIAQRRKLTLHQRGALLSLSVGASVGRAVRELLKLYERARRFRPNAVGIATSGEAAELFPACDRQVPLSKESSEEPRGASMESARLRMRDHFLADPDVWESVLAEVGVR